jgi:transcriptional regulator with XRE-family HTH domain
MKTKEYMSAQDTLQWTHKKLAKVLGISRRTPYRYQSGEVKIPEPAARLVRLLVLLRLTLSERKFEEIIKQLD